MSIVQEVISIIESHTPTCNDFEAVTPMWPRQSNRRLLAGISNDPVANIMNRKPEVNLENMYDSTMSRRRSPNEK
jgi:hypothetical protein